MYLVKCPCGLMLPKISAHFGGASYAVVGWAGVQVKTKQAAERGFNKQA